jgi:hypothetical protein
VKERERDRERERERESERERANMDCQSIAWIESFDRGLISAENQKLKFFLK